MSAQTVEMKVNDQETLERRGALVKDLKLGRFQSFYMYDAKGSELYHKITQTPEYYICRAEQAVIDQHITTIAPWGSKRHILIELGAGVGTKTHTLMKTFRDNAPNKEFLYAPIDCDAWALEQNKKVLSEKHPDIQCELFVGLFEDMIGKALALEGDKTILFQGSTFGNFKSSEEAVEFLKMVTGHMGPSDRIILGVDTWVIQGLKSLECVVDCYKKSTDGHREEFMLNALEHAKRATQLDFDRSKWKRVVTCDEKEMCVLQHLEALQDQTIRSIPEGEVVMEYKKGDKVLLQVHFKFTPEKLAQMAQEAGMQVTQNFFSHNKYFLWCQMQKCQEGKTDYSPEDRALVLRLLKQNIFHTMFLYDAKGSQLYESITKQPEYYLTSTEARLIEEKIHDIAPWGSTKHILVELGAGVGEKTHKMLPAMKKASPKGNFVYCPIDCDGWCLETNQKRLKEAHPDIECEILVGLYEDMLLKVKDMKGQKTILFLGSTICNFNSDEETVKFIKMVKDCMKSGDRLIIGVDTPPKAGKKSVDFVHDAYRKSTGGHREEFMMNGLDHASRRAGVVWDRKKFKRVTEWNPKKSAVLHYYEALESHDLITTPEGDAVHSFKAGDRILASTHSKFDNKKVTSLVEAAGMSVTKNWTPSNEHFLWCEVVLGKGRSGSEQYHELKFISNEPRGAPAKKKLRLSKDLSDRS